MTQQPIGSGPKRLTRARDDRMIAGIAAGVARYLDVDPTVVRVVLVIALVLGFPATAIAYLVAWAIIPEA